jgi:cytochrome c-type biogenesis protein CcmF
MISLIANNLLLANLIILLLSFYANVVCSSSKASLMLSNVSTVINSGLMLCLIWAFACSDFSIENVFLFSSTIQPVIYKIGAIWSSHQGSMLFFLWLLSIVIFISATTIKLDKKSLQIFLRITTFVSFILLTNIYFFSNPFIYFGAKASQGMGLNPVLQDIALVIHPPILYSGYVALLVPFALSITALYDKKYLSICLPAILFYSRISWFLITIGISLGSWWAYRELGWGGYWFFDPVENASLLPWIFVTALYHVCLRGAKFSQYYAATLSLGILPFLSVLLSTFFVRSGLLVSVHSFTNDVFSSLYLGASFCCIIIPSIIFWMINIHKFQNALAPFKNSNTRIYSVGILCLIISAFIIIISLIYPVAIEYLYQNKITINNEFFIYILLPIFLITALCAALSKASNHFTLGIFALFILIIVFGLLYFKYYHASSSAVIMLNCFAVFCAVSLILSSIKMILKAYRDVKISKATLKMFLGHVGYAFFISTVTFNNLWLEEVDFHGKVGDSITFKNLKIKLQNIRYSEAPNYYSHITDFWITRQDNNYTFMLAPENRLYKVEAAIMPEVAIKHFWNYDLYAVLSSNNQDDISAKFYSRPFMNFLWFSLACVALAIIL